MGSPADSGSGSLTDVPGIKLGHAGDLSARTGCTAVLFPRGAVAGVTVVGSASGSREVSALSPWGLVKKVHGICFAGGSAFGLAAADGVIRFLEERRIGFPVGKIRVPVVPAAIIFDLNVGRSDIRPDPEMGYLAARSAADRSDERGSVGAGTGATVGKVLGMEHCMCGGLGMASTVTPAGARVAALAVVNAFGDVTDPGTGAIVAGARKPDGPGFLDSERYIAEVGLRTPPEEGRNTTLCLVATDAALDRAEAHKLARLAVAGLYRAVRPSGTMLDGDMVFAASLGGASENLTVLGVTAAAALARAIVDAVLNADGQEGVPSCRSFAPSTD